MPMYEETRTVVGQPWRLAAVLMSSCALFLVILAVASPAWVTNDSRRNSQSIWEVCWGSDALEKCVNTLGNDWRVTIVILEFLTGLLCVIAIILAVLAVCKVLSIRSFVPGVCILLAALLQLIAVIVYPVKFLAEPVRLPPPVYYEFDWGYGVAFGAFFFMVAAGIMFFLKSYSNKQSY